MGRQLGCEVGGGEMDFDDAVDDWYDESIIWYYSRAKRRLVKRKR